MAFRKAIRGRITAGGKPGKSGLNASTGGKIRRHAGTIPTAYWRVNGVASDSTTLVDSSKAGHSLNGTLEGTIEESGADATWNTTGLLPGSHQSLYFNGSNNKVTVPYNALFKPDNAIKKLTVSMWIKTTGNQRMILICEEDANPGTAGWFYSAVGAQFANKANGYWSTAVNPGSSWRAGTSDVNDNNWHNLVFIRDGDSILKIYVDGELELQYTDQSGDWLLNNVPLLIGSRTNFGAKFYKFFMDEIAYWTDIALTDDQVKDMYNNGKVLDIHAGVLRN